MLYRYGVHVSFLYVCLPHQPCSGFCYARLGTHQMTLLTCNTLMTIKEQYDCTLL